MKVIKSHDEMLEKLEGKDRFYQVSGVIKRLLANQSLQRPFTYRKKGWGEIERVESTTDGTIEDKRTPKRKSRVRKGEVEIKTGDCWTFKTAKDGVIFKEEHILIPWATPFGTLKKSFLRSLAAQKKLRYDAPPLDLIKVYPQWLDVGTAPCESQLEGRVPERVLETRHTQSGDVMVDVFFDFVENRPFNCYIEVDSEAPINEERLVGLIKSLNSLDNIGASKRGSMRISHVAQVELTKDELEKLERGEPVQPVVY